MADPVSRGGCCGCTSDSPEPRRGFLGALVALGLGAAAYAAPVIAGVASFLNPLRQKGQADQAVRVASLDALDSTPRKVPVVMDRVDAWNKFPNEPVGAVFLRRTSASAVEAIHVVCPHAGCYVSFDAAANQFVCPCHLAHFSPEGKRLDATSPSPRDLDTLEVEIRNGSEVWVTFQNFRTGTTEKVAEA